MANYLSGLGSMIIVIGIIVGLAIGAIYGRNDFNWLLALEIIIPAIITGSLFLALSEIIDMLYDIKNKK